MWTKITNDRATWPPPNVSILLAFITGKRSSTRVKIILTERNIEFETPESEAPVIIGGCDTGDYWTLAELPAELEALR